MLISPKAEKLFNEALTLSPGEREAWLSKACADNPELFDEVSSLLTAANESEAYFGALSDRVSLATLATDDDDAIAGKLLGQWKLVSLIGRGGMGSVYLAERADGQFEKQVALKTLPIGLDGDVARSRFVAERQILARLVHDNIARLLDGGVSEDGTPYFVMDLVSGERIDDYCKHHDCTLEEKVDLVVQVARGVQFAHRNLIIHRDLKPTNILVDDRGRPRLLDFGIAKVLEPTAGSEELTQLAHRPVTPAYASPEMLRGEAVDVTTDVYSLGAVLYQLVTGSLPIDIEGLNLAQLHERITVTDPVLPSRLNSRVDGDLDAILLKALAKNPAERYESIESLAQDLRNWRRGLPVDAKTPSPFYRMGKFVRRNVVGVSLAAVAALSLGGFALFASYSASKSERQAQAIAAERDRAEATRDFLVSIFEGAGPKAGGETLTAAQLLDAGRTRIKDELAGNPRLQSDMYGVIAYVYSTMGLNNEWLELLYEQKPLIAEFEGEQSQAYFDMLVELAKAEDMVGGYDKAEAIAHELIELSKVLGSDVSEGDARSRLGRILHLKGDFQGADREYRKALSLFQQELGDDNMRTADAKLDLATLLDQTQFHQQAYDLFREVEETHKRVKKDEEIIETDLYLGLARSLGNLKRYDEALEIYQQTFEANERLYGVDYSHNLYILSGMSHIAEAKGDFDQALELQNGALRLIRMHTPESPNVGRSLLNIGRFYHRSSRCELAVPVLRQALDVFTEKLPDHAVVGQAKWRLGACLAEFDRMDEAEALIVEGNEILAKHLAPDHKKVVQAREAAAGFFASLGRTGEASKYR